MAKDSVCKGCKDRKLDGKNCHDVCIKYTAEVLVNMEKNDKIFRLKEKENIVKDVKIKQIKKSTRKPVRIL